MSGAVKLLALGGAAFWAHKNGHFDPVLAHLRTIGVLPALGDAHHVVPEATGLDSLTVESTGYDLSPEEPENPPASYAGSTSDEETLLRQNWADVQPWARSNLKWTAAMMWQESRGDTAAISSAGARGLMQVMPSTMVDIYDRLRFRKYEPEPMTLHLPNVGIYYGTAYLQHLATDYANGGNREWMTRAYNAGPGGKRSNGTWPSETVAYLAAIKGRFAAIS